MSDASIRLSEAIALHQAGNFERAAAAYEQVLSVKSDSTDALVNLGSVYRQLNKLDQAEARYQRAIQLQPTATHAKFNLGNLYIHQGRWRAAFEQFDQIVQIEPKHGAALLQSARCYREIGHYPEAMSRLKTLLKIEPNNANALLDYGNIFYFQSDYTEAEHCFKKNIKINAESWKGHYGLARVYDCLGKKKPFKKHFDLALEYTEEPVQVRFALAQSRYRDGRFKDAAAEFLNVIEINPDYHTAKIALGACLIHLDRKADANEIFNEVARVDDFVVLNELAKTIWEYKYFDEAIQILKRIVSMKPDNADVHLNLAKAHFQKWDLSMALDGFKRALAINPKHEEAQDLMADVYVREGRADKAFELYKNKLNRVDGVTKFASGILFTQLYCEDQSVEHKAEYHRQLMQQWDKRLPEFKKLYKPKLKVSRKLNIGLVSADFRDQHPVGILIQAFLKHVDHRSFHVKAYYNVRTMDESTLKIKSLTDGWEDVEGWSDAKLQQKLVKDKIDILIDLSGHTSKNRLMMFTKRAAPIQVSWMGYPHSTGIKNMDYLLGDNITTPQEHQSLFSETIIPIDGHCVFCLSEMDEYDAPRRRTDADPLVLGSFNNLSKINRSTLKLWCKVLNELPDAHFKMKTPSFTDPKCMRDVMDFFVSQGVDESRLHFSGPCGLKDMMDEYNQVDIALDTLTYNGGMTSLQALTMGVPVIALKGENFCSRMGASILHHADMRDWIVDSEDAYIKKVKQKSMNLKKLRQYKFELRDHLKTTPLCDSKGYTKQVSAQLKAIWKDYCAKDKKRL